MQKMNATSDNFPSFSHFFSQRDQLQSKRRLRVPPRVFGPHCFLSVICQLCFHPIWIAFQWRHIWTAPGCHGPIFFQASSCVEIMPLSPDWRRQTNGAIWFLHKFNGRNGGNWPRHCHITLILMLCNLASAQSIATIKYSCILVIVPQNDLSDQPQEMESLCSNV